jgi:uncharacterized protein YdhG (YjbR/CyaY superfamily)
MSYVDEYLATLSGTQKTELERVCAIVRDMVSGVEELKTYGVPTFKKDGKYLFAFAAAKKHLSIYPGAGAVEAVEDELVGFDMSKGTIRFTPERPIPEPVLRQVITYRLQDTSD